MTTTPEDRGPAVPDEPGAMDPERPAETGSSTKGKSGTLVLVGVLVVLAIVLVVVTIVAM